MRWVCVIIFMVFFFFNDTATTEIYTLSLHDALPISGCSASDPWPLFSPVTEVHGSAGCPSSVAGTRSSPMAPSDRKSTRLNSSHANISYAVFCLKKKKPTKYQQPSNHQNKHDC